MVAEHIRAISTMLDGGGEIAIASADATKVQAAEIKATGMGYEIRFPVGP